MRVDISRLIGQKGASMPITLSLRLDKLEENPDVVGFLAPVVIKGCVTNLDGLYLVEAMVDTVLSMICGRCLTSTDVTVRFKLEEKFSNTGITDEEEIETFSGDVIDLTDVVIKNILFCVPMKALCKTDCKGLCPVCGKDLNDGDCGCDTTELDPRLESLRSLFKFDEEV